MIVYRVRWDNGHACGTLSGSHDSEEEATVAGEDWLAEMMAATPGAVVGDYEYEVVEETAEDDDGEDPSDEMGELRKAALSRGQP